MRYPVSHSINVTNMVDAAYSRIRLSSKGVRNDTTTLTPTPYMGQIGPLRNPLFTNFPCLKAANATSVHHPRNPYVKKYRMK